MTNIIKHFNAIHGEAGKDKTKEYRSWAGIIDRCTNVRNRKYQDYGGRGIKVCDHWRTSYQNFLSDMGRAPSPSHSVDRINNNGNYEPSNCRWATKKEQSNNTRRNKIITYNNQKKSLSEFCDEFGLKYGMVSQRLSDGWSYDEAFNNPSYANATISPIASLDELQVRTIRHLFQDKIKLKDIATYFRVSKTTIHRIKYGLMYKRLAAEQKNK